MKKLIVSIILLAVLLLPFNGFGGDGQVQMSVTTALDAVTVALSTTQTSSVIDLANVRGYFSVQYLITGDGTITLSYTLSNDGSTYLLPSADSDIATGLTKTSGPGSDGKDIIMFNPSIARFMKITATETGGANSAVVTVNTAIE